jgi:hypothetical protein
VDNQDVEPETGVMSTSTRFLLLVIIGLAIAIIGSHFLTIFLGILLMLSYYVMPLVIGLVLLFVAWKLVFSSGKQPEKKQELPQQPTKKIPTKSANPDTEIERELNRMKHQMGQFTKGKPHNKP